jgi:putative transposase
LRISRSRLEDLYKREENRKVKERRLLIMRVEGDGAIPAHVAEELHRSRPWASYWLDRYIKEGVDGLRDKPRSGRPSKLPMDVALEVRRELAESRQGWTTKQAREVIARRGGVKYHAAYIYRLLYRWGFKLKVPRRVHVKTASKEEKGEFKKR